MFVCLYVCFFIYFLISFHLLFLKYLYIQKDSCCHENVNVLFNFIELVQATVLLGIIWKLFEICSLRYNKLLPTRICFGLRGGRVFWQTRIPVHFFLHSRIPGIYFCQSQITENTENTLLLGFSDEIFSIPGFSEQKWENPGPRNDYIFPDSRKKLHQFSDSRNKNDQSRNPEAPPPTIEEQKAF